MKRQTNKYTLKDTMAIITGPLVVIRQFKATTPLAIPSHVTYGNYSMSVFATGQKR